MSINDWVAKASFHSLFSAGDFFIGVFKERSEVYRILGVSASVITAETKKGEGVSFTRDRMVVAMEKFSARYMTLKQNVDYEEFITLKTA